VQRSERERDKLLQKGKKGRYGKEKIGVTHPLGGGKRKGERRSYLTIYRRGQDGRK